MKIFVYGTLKSNKHNHDMLMYDKFLGKATLKDYGIFVGKLPYLTKRVGASTKGELYTISEEMLNWLDYFEGHPSFYKRISVTVQTEDGKLHETFAYLYPAEFEDTDVLTEEF